MKPIEINWKTLETREGTNLPHWSCEGAIYHVSFRLEDSIPKAKRKQWFGERNNILDNAKQMGRELSEHEMKRLQYLYSEKVEDFLDSGC